MKTFSRLFAPFAALAAVAAATPALADEVNLYTTREPGLIKPLLESFEKETGTKVNTVFLKDGLVERVKAEGAGSPADVLMTVDFGNLVDLVDQGVTQPVTSPTIEKAVPAQLRDKDGNWTALSVRARVVYADKDLDVSGLTYEQLADPKWKGKICIRSGQHPYNTALIAALLVKDGPEKTKTWLEGVKANLARKAAGGDRDVARDIMGGLCDVGVANSYYIGLMRAGKGGKEQEEWGKAVKIVLPTFADGSGAHVNISGAAVAKNAPNKDGAIKLIDYLLSDAAQTTYAEGNFELPVKPGVKAHPLIAELDALKVDKTPLSQIAAQRKEASKLVDQVGFDN